MLRAATREHESNGARPVGSLSAEHSPCVARRQRARSRFRAVRHDNPALDHLRAACLERPGDVRQQGGITCNQRGGESVSRTFQRTAGSC
jgi:hypothetical protein